jgi:hypothetical protein
MLEIDLDRVPGSHRSSNSIYGWNFGQFFLKSSKPFIPEDKYLAEILVHILRVNCMMNPVMRRSHNDLLQKSHFINVLSMIPELRKQVKRSNNFNHLPGNAKYRCR